jgi:hypothetical protein
MRAVLPQRSLHAFIASYLDAGKLHFAFHLAASSLIMLAAPQLSDYMAACRPGEADRIMWDLW